MVSGSCVSCSTLINGCSTCSSSTACTSCSTTLHFASAPNLAQTCDCDSAFIFDPSNVCVLCSSTLPNCDTCSSQSICTSCNFNYTLNTTASPAVCISCYSIMIGCSTCNLTNCLSCDVGNSFTANVDGNGIITNCACIND